MPANLTPEYREAEKRFREARTVAERIEALEHMLAVMPHHKGTDHLRADLRARIAKLTDEAQRQHGAARANVYSVRKEGAGQVALLGAPNVGKSQLLAALTDASPRIAPYPFTTQLPLPAMMPHENVHVQLVDLPPLVAGATPAWIRPIVRQADLLLVVVDLADDPLANLDTALAELQAMRVEPVATAPPQAADVWVVQKATLVVANKLDQPVAADVFELVEAACANRLPCAAVSAAQALGLDALRHELFARLDVVRVYTRAPGQPVDRARPFVLRRGQTLEDLAESIHKEWRERIRYAQVWGSGKYQGQRVSRAYVPSDGDVVELVVAG